MKHVKVDYTALRKMRTALLLSYKEESINKSFTKLNYVEKMNIPKVSDELYIFTGAYIGDTVTKRNNERAESVEFCSVDDDNKEPFVVLSYEQSLIFEASHNVMYPVTNFSSREEYYKFFREFKKYYNLGKEADEKQIIKK